MADDSAPEVQQEDAPEKSGPQSIEAAYEDARLSTESEREVEASPTEDAPPAGDVAESAELKWAKSVGGLVAEDGTLANEAALKKLYNQEKYVNDTAQKLTAYQRILQDPKVQEFVRERANNPQQESNGKSEDSRSEDEKELDTYLDQYLERKGITGALGSVLAKTDKTYDTYVSSEIDSAVNALKESFPEYDKPNSEGITLRDQVGTAMQRYADNRKITPEQAVLEFVQRGNLTQVCTEAAKSIRYEEMKAELEGARKTRSEENGAKRASVRTLPRGTSSNSLTKIPNEVGSMEEAWKMAREELEAGT